MKSRMALATFVLVVGGPTLSACSIGGSSSDDPTTPASPAPTTASSDTPSETPAPASPSTAPTISTAADLVGDWQAPKARWVVHFKQDGTFTEDFQGINDFRVGKYQVSGTNVTLIGGDGNSDTGTIRGESLVFRLGTLTRK